MTTRTNLALRVLMTCGINHGEKLRTADIAERCNASVQSPCCRLSTLCKGMEFCRKHCGGRGRRLKRSRHSGEISIGEVFRIFRIRQRLLPSAFRQRGTLPAYKPPCPCANYTHARAWTPSTTNWNMVTLQDLCAESVGCGNCLQWHPQSPPKKLRTRVNKSANQVSSCGLPYTACCHLDKPRHEIQGGTPMRRVVINGLGVISPIGNNARKFSTACRKGRSGSVLPRICRNTGSAQTGQKSETENRALRTISTSANLRFMGPGACV